MSGKQTITKATAAAPHSPPAPMPPPDEPQRRAIALARERVAKRAPRLEIKLETNADGSIANIGPDHDNHDGWVARLQDALGTHGRAFPISQLNHLLAVARGRDGKYDLVKINALLAAIEGAQPADEVQAMLAVQMAGTHELAMQALRRMQSVEQIPQYDSAGNMAVKLLRTFTAQVEALAKLQRGGEQIVKVVHVHSGGQAIVGNVSTGANGARGPRGGGSDEIRNQPHAPQIDQVRQPGRLTSEQGAAMPGLHPSGKPVSVTAGERASTLPDARRCAGQRGTEG